MVKLLGDRGRRNGDFDDEEGKETGGDDDDDDDDDEESEYVIKLYHMSILKETELVFRLFEAPKISEIAVADPQIHLLEHVNPGFDEITRNLAIECYRNGRTVG